MIDTNKLEDLRTHALIVKHGLLESIIDSHMYASQTMAQALAIATVCDKVLDLIDDYLVYSEEYDEKYILVELLSIKYLLCSIHTDKIGYCDVVLECSGFEVTSNFWSMINCLKKY